MASCNLNRSPRHNWVEDCGGLGDLGNVACHMIERGVPEEKAIPAAINFAKHVCATDQSKNFTISNPTHHVAGWKRARWCAAAARWETLKACARAKRDGKAMADDVAALEAEVAAVDLVELGVVAAPEPLVEVAGFKAVATSNAGVTELQNGDLLIEGWASDFEEDRDEEAFTPGAFDQGIKAFMKNPILAYHHATRKSADGEPPQYLALGKVLSLDRRPQGLWAKAVVQKPAPGSWAEDVYEKIRTGTVKAFSVGGKFYRRMTAKGPRIFRADLQELTVTPLPVNPRTLFSVVAEGKSVDGEPLHWEPADEAEIEEVVDGLKALVGALEHAVDVLGR